MAEKETDLLTKQEMIIGDVVHEMEQGNLRWGDFHSLQEGYAVIEESLEQFRSEMVFTPRANWNGTWIRKRLVKMTAMSLKLLAYVSSGVDIRKRTNNG